MNLRKILDKFLQLKTSLDSNKNYRVALLQHIRVSDGNKTFLIISKLNGLVKVSKLDIPIVENRSIIVDYLRNKELPLKTQGTGRITKDLNA